MMQKEENEAEKEEKRKKHENQQKTRHTHLKGMLRPFRKKEKKSKIKNHVLLDTKF